MMLFHKATKTLYNWLIQQPNVKEESITDWLLFELSKTCAQIKYYAFSRHQEAVNGADWEWWVLTTYHAYRFRVQAKKAKPKVDNYASIGYSNANGLQIDLFIESAKKDSAFPLYMFYSSAEYDTYKAKNCFPVPELIEMIEWCDSCDNGGFLSPAHMVYDVVFANPKTFIPAESLLNMSLKLSTLDIVFSKTTPKEIDAEVERRLNELNKYYLHQVQYKKDSFSGNYGFRYEYEQNSNRSWNGVVPNWLLYLAGNRQNQLPEWFESEYGNQLPSTLGVAVLDLRA